MNASVIDLRYRMRDVLKDHEFFGMNAGDGDTVDSVMEKLRGGRNK
jgi:hypothetical protein